MEKTFNLLIIYRDNERKIINSVSRYGICETEGFMYYIKNGYKSFIPFDAIKFFGREWDYENR